MQGIVCRIVRPFIKVKKRFCISAFPFFPNNIIYFLSFQCRNFGNCKKEWGKNFSKASKRHTRTKYLFFTNHDSLLSSSLYALSSSLHFLLGEHKTIIKRIDTLRYLLFQDGDLKGCKRLTWKYFVNGQVYMIIHEGI